MSFKGLVSVTMPSGGNDFSIWIWSLPTLYTRAQLIHERLGMGCGADSKSGSTSGFHNLHQRSSRAQHFGIYSWDPPPGFCRYGIWPEFHGSLGPQNDGQAAPWPEAQGLRFAFSGGGVGRVGSGRMYSHP